MMTYDYNDEFMINSVDPLVLSSKEEEAITEVDGIGTFSEPFRGKLVTSLVYMNLAVEQLESDGMQDKYNAYSKEFKRIINVAQTQTTATVSNIPIGRG